MRARAGILGLGLAAMAVGAAWAVSDITSEFKAGKHLGEVGQLAVDAQFHSAFGSTTTDATGIHYSFFGITLSEPKVYPTRYWGTFPLYFFGSRVGATVTVTNTGPRAKEKLRVTTQVYTLELDGTSGVKLAPDIVTDFWVDKGETKVIDASFTPQFVAGADSGLDRVVILVQHPNEGGGPGNEWPALILAKEAVLCPPAVEAQGKK